MSLLAELKPVASGMPDDGSMMRRLPVDLRALLETENGFVAYRGGLHVRGAVLQPDWHSLRWALDGEEALHRHYVAVHEEDIPFAQNALGDQFLLRATTGDVRFLDGESGELEPVASDLAGFFDAVVADPVETLRAHAHLQFLRDGNELLPGQLLNAYPPFITEPAAGGVSLKAVPASEQLLWLRSLHAQIANLPDKTPIRFKVIDD